MAGPGRDGSTTSATPCWRRLRSSSTWNTCRRCAPSTGARISARPMRCRRCGGGCGAARRCSTSRSKSFARFNVGLTADMDTGASGEIGQVARDAPSMQVITSPEVKHTEEDTEEWVPAAGLEQVGRAYAKIIDEINRLPRRDLLPAATGGATARAALTIRHSTDAGTRRTEGHRSHPRARRAVLHDAPRRHGRRRRQDRGAGAGRRYARLGAVHRRLEQLLPRRQPQQAQPRAEHQVG